MTRLKQAKECAWLRQYSSNMRKQGSKDAAAAYKRFFGRGAKHPKFKKKNKQSSG